MRQAFAGELEQLRLQVEVMGVRVDENLERSRTILRHGDLQEAARALDADDDIDAMLVSLTERCYDLLCREHPMASDLRFIVSVLRVLEEFERIGDLALRVVKLAPDHDLLTSNPATFDILLAMADEAVELFRTALRAWAEQDLDTATDLATRPRPMDMFQEHLSAELLRIRGVDAVPVAVKTSLAGRSLERIADHAVIIGARVRYVLTGDPTHLAWEVR
jgi:phosphate transport system protein